MLEEIHKNMVRHISDYLNIVWLQVIFLFVVALSNKLQLAFATYTIMKNAFDLNSERNGKN